MQDRSTNVFSVTDSYIEHLLISIRRSLVDLHLFTWIRWFSVLIVYAFDMFLNGDDCNKDGKKNYFSV